MTGLLEPLTGRTGFLLRNEREPHRSGLLRRLRPGRASSLQPGTPMLISMVPAEQSSLPADGNVRRHTFRTLLSICSRGSLQAEHRSGLETDDPTALSVPTRNRRSANRAPLECRGSAGRRGSGCVTIGDVPGRHALAVRERVRPPLDGGFHCRKEALATEHVATRCNGGIGRRREADGAGVCRQWLDFVDRDRLRRPGRPSLSPSGGPFLFSAIARIIRTPDLRRKIAFTLGIIVLYNGLLTFYVARVRRTNW